jgi:hypothetical protein
VAAVTADVTGVNLRDGYGGCGIAECDRSPELAVARGFVEDVVPHLGTRRLNAVLV